MNTELQKLKKDSNKGASVPVTFVRNIILDNIGSRCA